MRMKRSGLVCVCASLLAASWYGTARSQGREEGEWLRVIQYVVEPSKAAQFQEVAREVAEVLRREGATDISYSCMRSEEVVFTFILPLLGLGDVELQLGALDRVGSELGEDWARRAAEAIEYTNEFMVVNRPDLSYAPKEPRLSADEIGMTHFDFYYLDFGSQGAASETARRFAGLHKEMACDTGFEVYEVMRGAELPLLIIATPAKSMADFYTNQEKVMQTLGSRVAGLAEARDAVVRRIERIDATILRDLSYQPAATTTSD